MSFVDTTKNNTPGYNDAQAQIKKWEDEENAKRAASRPYELSESQQTYDPIEAQRKQMEAFSTPDKYADAMLPQSQIDEQNRLNMDAQTRQNSQQARMGFKNDPAMQAAMDRRVSQGFKSDVARYRRQLKAEQPEVQSRLAASVGEQAAGAYGDYFNMANRQATLQANAENAKKRVIGSIITIGSTAAGAIIGGVATRSPQGAYGGAMIGYGVGSGVSKGGGFQNPDQELQ